MEVIKIDKEFNLCKEKTTGIYSNYLYVMENELKLNDHIEKKYWPSLAKADVFLKISQRLLEIAKSNFILRCMGNMGHLTGDLIAFESVGGHTNYVRAIMGEFLDFVYAWLEPPNYTRKTIDLALKIHDLPENVTGDIPDNDESKKLKKDTFENAYYEEYLALYGPYDEGLNPINKGKAYSYLIRMKGDKLLKEERGGYLADKFSAIGGTLCFNKLADDDETHILTKPFAYYDDPNISDINRHEMDLCDEKYHGGYLLSEVWTVDFLHERKLNRFDDTGFFTGLLAMTTLLCNGKWYEWRKAEYLP